MDNAQKFQEIFHCQVKGTDIADARFNAYTALEMAIAGKIPLNNWKLSQMQHDLQVAEDEEGNQFPIVVCEAIWICDPESDDDGGKYAMLLGPENLDPDGIKQNEPQPELIND